MSLHSHNWVQQRVTFWPAPVKERPVTGATVLWRCAARGCTGLRATKYIFRRPSKKQPANLMSKDWFPEEIAT